MAWYNPFSWGGGPDEVDWGPLRNLAGQVQQGGADINRQLQNIDFGITGADQQQWGKSYGHMRDMVISDLERTLPGILAGASNQAGARGLAGSNIEGIMRAATAGNAQFQAGQTLAGFGAQQAGQMAQFAANRGQQELSRNQQLFNTLLGSIQPMMGIEGQFLSSEMDRIAREKSAFGGLLGGIGNLFAPGLGNLIGKIPGFGG
jgi:hypothetical protein